MPASSVDKSGHRLVETYLDRQRPSRAQIKGLIVQAMDAL
jgi:hypothetical protein